MKFVSSILAFAMRFISPASVESALKVLHKAVDGLEKAEKAAAAKTATLDASIEKLIAQKSAQVAIASTANRVAGNLRAVIA